MYTVNLTFKVPTRLVDEWLTWMQKTWQPDLIDTCAAEGTQLFRLLGHDDEHGSTLIYQLFLPSKALLNRYFENHQDGFHQHIREKWGDDVLFFQTVLERIDN